MNDRPEASVRYWISLARFTARSYKLVGRYSTFVRWWMIAEPLAQFASVSENSTDWFVYCYMDDHRSHYFDDRQGQFVFPLPAGASCLSMTRWSVSLHLPSVLRHNDRSGEVQDTLIWPGQVCSWYRVSKAPSILLRRFDVGSVLDAESRVSQARCFRFLPF